jgi:chemotaxis signal transduction protein
VAVAAAGGDRLAGFVADRVSEVVNLRERDLRDNTVRIKGRLRRLLDPEQILTEEELRNLALTAAECSLPEAVPETS